MTFHQWHTPREDERPVSTTHVADDYAAIAARMRELAGEATQAADPPGIPSFSSMGPVGPAGATLPPAISISDTTYIQMPAPPTFVASMDVAGPPPIDFGGAAQISDVCIQECILTDGDFR